MTMSVGMAGAGSGIVVPGVVTVAVVEPPSPVSPGGAIVLPGVGAGGGVGGRDVFGGCWVIGVGAGGATAVIVRMGVAVVLTVGARTPHELAVVAGRTLVCGKSADWVIPSMEEIIARGPPRELAPARLR
jgi:hypothetical protein